VVDPVVLILLNPCSLVHAIDDTHSILTDLQKFNKQSWIVRYPHLAPAQPSVAEGNPSHHLRRSLSFADDPVSFTDVLVTPHKKTSMKRSLTLASIPDPANDEFASSTEVADSEAETLIDPSAASDFHVLRLDLKLGSSSSASSLVAQLEKSSIASLLDDRIRSSLAHVSKLRTRVLDTSSKVLVTGDLNAGKSTFVNALLRRDIMPMDQQPCTTMFCEVHDKAENDGEEEAHIVKDGLGVTYDRLDPSTYTRVAIDDLDALLADQDPFSESQQQGVLKLYLSDTRRTGESLLTNGLVSISLIDAPGLNRDSFKTTSLFSRQEEIDVIVFVVSAENHFTLSAKEFLWNASNEKAYVFVVVNRFDMIRDKEKCKRIVLEQIKQFSPATWEDRDDLVHFVDSASALAHGLLQAHQRKEPENSNPVPSVSDQAQSQRAFQALESSLRTFVLSKRFKSKLLPARTYITHLLSDIDLLAQSNAIVAQGEAERAGEELEAKRPVLEGMLKGKDGLEDGLEGVEETVVKSVKQDAKDRLESALDRVGKGEVGVTSRDLATLPHSVMITPPSLPPYPGLFGIWGYARDVRRTLLASIDLAVKIAEEDARAATVDGVAKVNSLEDKYLPTHPPSAASGIPAEVRTRRVFMPQAMFVPRLSHDKGRKRSNRERQSATSMVVAGGSQGLGLGLLTQRSDLMEVTFVDILDLNHHLMTRLYPRRGKKDDESDDEDDDDDASASALGTLGLGLGAIMMVGGRTIGARGLIEGVIRASDLLFESNGVSGRWWIAPLVGAATLGFTIYFVLELPREIPRTVGRRIRSALNHPDKLNATATSLARTPLTAASTGGSTGSVAVGAGPRFADIHADRISRETRKVLRLAAWDLRERFRAAMEESGRDVKSAEEAEKRAMDAIKWFTQAGERTGSVRVSISD
jgi:mitofusin 2